MINEQEHTSISLYLALPGRGRVPTEEPELVARAVVRDGMVAGGTQPSPIHKRPFFMPSPVSTATSGSNGDSRGSASSPYLPLYPFVYSSLLILAPSFTHRPKSGRSGSSLSRVRVATKHLNRETGAPVSLSCKRKH